MSSAFYSAISTFAEVYYISLIVSTTAERINETYSFNYLIL